jgi:hypothetical protein
MTLQEVLFDKSFLTIQYSADDKLIHLKWKGHSTSEQYKEGLNFALEMVKDLHIENWLGNLKMMEIILPQDEDWSTQEWYPLLAKTTLKKMAIVTSLDFLNNSAVKRIVKTSEDLTTFETRFFVDVADAHFWLKSI